MKQENYQKGKTGEEIAADFLRNKGFQILEQNFHTRFGEIDLICIDHNLLIFVEVKLKIGENYGTPEEMITRGKIFQVTRTAQAYLLENPGMENRFSSFRIDAVAVVLDNNKNISRVTHYENVGSEF